MSGSWVWVISTSTFGDRVVAVPLDQRLRRALDHVDAVSSAATWCRNGGALNIGLSRSVLGSGELRVELRADRLTG